MNYRHGFHAGNHADVFKHVVLVALVAALQRKDAPLFLLDTHAGRGAYDLAGEQAQRTGEAREGIGRLRDCPASEAPAAVLDYLRLLDRLTPQPGRYPGSPWLLQALLRERDRLAVCELQAEEVHALRDLLAGDRRVAVHQRDGYEALPALCPPAERRGLVLIDPPYELQRDEFAPIERSLDAALRRWPGGVYALWYPIKRAAELRAPLRRLAALPCKQVLCLELLVRPDDSPLRMNGSGMLILNPPWQLQQQLQPALDWLAARLDDGGGCARAAWLKQEAS